MVMVHPKNAQALTVIKRRGVSSSPRVPEKVVRSKQKELKYIMTVFQRLAKRIYKDLGVDLDTTSFRRTYAGKWLKAGGAFSWTCRLKENGLVEVGSCWSASELLRSRTPLTMSRDGMEIEIFPEREEKNDS